MPKGTRKQMSKRKSTQSESTRESPFVGPLADCPESPNCVCTQATRQSQTMPAIRFGGEASTAIARIAEDATNWPRAHIVSHRPNYLHLTFHSLLFRFVDDVEFFADDSTHLLHFRSASRLGYSDLGVNRRRMEKLSGRIAKLLQTD